MNHSQVHPNTEKIINDEIMPKTKEFRGSTFIDKVGNIRKPLQNHYDTVRMYGKLLDIHLEPFGDGTGFSVDDVHIHEFLQKTGIVRMQYFTSVPKTAIHIASKLTSSQIRLIQDVEKIHPDRKLAFAVGIDFNNMDIGEGFRNFMVNYRKHFGERNEP